MNDKRQPLRTLSAPRQARRPRIRDRAVGTAAPAPQGSVGHVDATLRLLDPSVDIDAIPTKRPRKRIKLFRQGELGRMILKALREAETPISTQDITSAILAAGGHGPSAQVGRHAEGARQPRLPAQQGESEQDRQR